MKGKHLLAYQTKVWQLENEIWRLENELAKALQELFIAENGAIRGGEEE